MEHGWSLAATFGQRAGLAWTYFVSFPWYEHVLGEILYTRCSRTNTRIVMVDTWTIDGCFMQNSILGNENRKFYCIFLVPVVFPSVNVLHPMFRPPFGYNFENFIDN